MEICVEGGDPDSAGREEGASSKTLTLATTNIVFILEKYFQKHTLFH